MIGRMIKGCGLARFRRDARGSVVVEAAIIAPVMVLMVAGVVDGSMAIHTRNGIQDAAYAGAAYAALNGPYTTTVNMTTMTANITTAAQNATSLSGITVSVSAACGYGGITTVSYVSTSAPCNPAANNFVSGSGNPGTYVQITVTGAYQPILGGFYNVLWGRAQPGAWPITQTAMARIT